MGRGGNVKLTVPDGIVFVCECCMSLLNYEVHIRIVYCMLRYSVCVCVHVHVFVCV